MVASIRRVSRPCVRWFWQLPFNPGSWQQLIAYIEGKGHTPGVNRKTRAATTDKASLMKLASETGDALYGLILDLRAVQKVDATYAVGTLQRLDEDNRIHPEIKPNPSTHRDSSVGPNLQNVVSDRESGDGKAPLATGFRRCIVARDGVPVGVTPAELQAWEAKWRTIG